MTKRTLFLYIIFLLVFCNTACQKQDNSIEGLNGTWTEVDTQTDTIVFNTNFIRIPFKQGYEIRNGHNLPKLGCGPYMYEISHDS